MDQRARSRKATAVVVLSLGVLALVGAWIWGRTDPTPAAVVASERDEEAPLAVLPIVANARRKTIAVTGRVVDPTDKPVAAALVCMSQRSAAGRGLFSPTCVETSAAGQFQLTFAEEGSFELVANASGFLAARFREPGAARDGIVIGHASRDDIVLKLGTGGIALRGSVTDALGGAVPGALVTTKADASEQLGIATTDAAGRFAIHVPGGPGKVTATADGYARTTRPYDAPSNDLQLVLTPGSEISGIVVTRVEGAPIANVQVTARTPADAIARDWMTVITTSDGRFTLGPLAAGVYQLDLTDPEYVLDSPWTVELTVSESIQDLVLRASPGVVVEGILGMGTEPCPFAKGRLSLGGDRFYEADTTDNGKIRLTGVAPGTYRLLATCEGAPPLREEIQVPKSGIANGAWAVPRGLTGRGTVTDVQGKAVPGRTVAITPTEPEMSSLAIASCITDPKGAFECTGLRPGSHQCTGSRFPREVVPV